MTLEQGSSLNEENQVAKAILAGEQRLALIENSLRRIENLLAVAVGVVTTEDVDDE